MIWLSWRLQRTETLLTAALVALLAAVFVPGAIHLASAYAHKHCANHDPACARAFHEFWLAAGGRNSVLTWLVFVPGIIGLALAAPLLLDLENGTFRLGWTQSVTRGRWLVARLSFAVVFAVVTALVAVGLLAALISWYRVPLDKVYGPWDHIAGFDVDGVVPMAYALFALGLGLAVGVVWRRTAAALVTSFVAYGAFRLFVESWLRPRYVAPRSVTLRLGVPYSPPLRLERGLPVWEGLSDKSGRPAASSVIEKCANAGPGCLARHGFSYVTTTYQPAGRFWEFQAIEFTLVGGLSVLLLAFAAWRVLRTE